MWREFYLGLLAKGTRPEMARLTLARKIAAITLKIWKKGETFDAEHFEATSSLSAQSTSERGAIVVLVARSGGR